MTCEGTHKIVFFIFVPNEVYISGRRVECHYVPYAHKHARQQRANTHMRIYERFHLNNLIIRGGKNVARTSAYMRRSFELWSALLSALKLDRLTVQIHLKCDRQQRVDSSKRKTVFVFSVRWLLFAVTEMHLPCCVAGDDDDDAALYDVAAM